MVDVFAVSPGLEMIVRLPLAQEIVQDMVAAMKNVAFVIVTLHLLEWTAL